MSGFFFSGPSTTTMDNQRSRKDKPRNPGRTYSSANPQKVPLHDRGVEAKCWLCFSNQHTKLDCPDWKLFRDVVHFSKCGRRDLQFIDPLDKSKGAVCIKSSCLLAKDFVPDRNRPHTMSSVPTVTTQDLAAFTVSQAGFSVGCIDLGPSKSHTIPPEEYKFWDGEPPAELPAPRYKKRWFRCHLPEWFISLTYIYINTLISNYQPFFFLFFPLPFLNSLRIDDESGSFTTLRIIFI